jgi:hypothetical protein
MAGHIERDRDKRWQGVVANSLNLFRGGDVGFIDLLDHLLHIEIFGILKLPMSG